MLWLVVVLVVGLVINMVGEVGRRVQHKTKQVQVKNTVAIKRCNPRRAIHSLLWYVYGGKVLYNLSNVKGIIDAADRYGVVHLKLFAESMYVKLTKISLDNVMDNLLYADAKNLPLLKEEVMNFIVENKVVLLGHRH